MKISEAIIKLEELKSVYGDLSLLILCKSGFAQSTMQIDGISHMQCTILKKMEAVFIESEGLNEMFKQERLRDY